MSGLRIGTWNLDTAPKRSVAEICDFLASKSADVWVLTETHDEVCPHPGFSVSHAGQQDLSLAPKRLRQGSRWVSIWSRYPLRESLRTADAQRSAATVLETPDGLIMIYGIVLPWPGSRPSFAKAAAQHGKDWTALKSRHISPLFVAGDFNCDLQPQSPFPGQQAVSVLKRAVTSAGLGFVDYGKNFGSLEDPIDHVLVPSYLVSETRVADAWYEPELSDHSGMIVQMKMAAREAPV